MTATRKPPPSAAATTASNLKKNDNQYTFQLANTTNVPNDAIMNEAHGKIATSEPSFKEELLSSLGPEGLKDANWGDLLNGDLPENRWYKEADETVPQNINPRTVIPEIPYTDEELEEWAKPWKNTLIVKVMGKRVNFRMLENKLRKEWVQHGTMSITDMAGDFYLVQLSDIEDYMHAIFEGPWKIADHYLIVQRWRPLFSLTAAMTKNVAVWIRIPKLPVELCNEKFLNRIGSTIGNMLKVDKTTSLYSRGKFARICVELDLEKPLLSHISIRGMKLCLEYEGLHSICFRCGKYGHKKDNCRELLEVEEENSTDTEIVQKEATTVEPMVVMPSDGQSSQQEQPASQDKKQEEPELGIWNIPKYVTRRKKNNSISRNPKKSGQDVIPQSVVNRATKKPQAEVVEVIKATGNGSKEPEVIQHEHNSQETATPPIAKSIAKEKIRNPFGGKNPQLSVKGKKGTKITKPPIRKDKGSVKDVRNKQIMASNTGGVNIVATGKENIPSTSYQITKSNGSKADNKAEEEAVMAYMKAMYMTHGENPLNRFKNLEPIRSALSHIDQNDHNRTGSTSRNELNDNNTSMSGDGKKVKVINATSEVQNCHGNELPKEAFEEVVPQTTNPVHIQ